MKNQNLISFIKKLSDQDGKIFSHGRRVAKLACAIVKYMNYSKGEIALIYRAAVIHDIGKFLLPKNIVNKPGILSEEERRLIQEHPRLGFELLGDLSAESVVCRVALQHHERLDGSGYPFGLRSNNIIFPSRVVAIADVVESMASPQVYREGYCMEKAVQEIKQNSGLLYDPSIVLVVVSMIEKEKFFFD